MTASTKPLVFGVTNSLSGKAWHWRGGNMDVRQEVTGLENDIVTQLLLSRGVAQQDVEQQRTPTLRGFLPDPSAFQDMDAAAE